MARSYAIRFDGFSLRRSVVLWDSINLFSSFDPIYHFPRLRSFVRCVLWMWFLSKQSFSNPGVMRGFYRTSDQRSFVVPMWSSQNSESVQKSDPALIVIVTKLRNAF
ncbi:hypothetical protein AVEN_91107-1 [Araneus ventricosus]|uniref:Uncharacterized protein n=1 Tax=Araneus ventricosus TaxID=182803 RepID=A0A4Y2JH36_ARAVE|nr:hypothetical protein AVEN_91107-1 [Araneus ventricosus]